MKKLDLAAASALQRPMADYYEILRTPRTANAKQIKEAFQKRFKELQSQGEAGQAELAQCREAYNVLRDPGRRAAYDSFLEQEANEPRATTRNRTAYQNQMVFHFYEYFYHAYARFGVMKRSIDKPLEWKEAFNIRSHALVKDFKVHARSAKKNYLTTSTVVMFGAASLSLSAELPTESARLLLSAKPWSLEIIDAYCTMHVMPAFLTGSVAGLISMTVSPAFATASALVTNIGGKLKASFQEAADKGALQTIAIGRATKNVGMAAYILSTVLGATLGYDFLRTGWLSVMEGKSYAGSNFPQISNPLRKLLPR